MIQKEQSAVEGQRKERQSLTEGNREDQEAGAWADSSAAPGC